MLLVQATKECSTINPGLKKSVLRITATPQVDQSKYLQYSEDSPVMSTNYSAVAPDTNIDAVWQLERIHSSKKALSLEWEMNTDTDTQV